MNTGIKYCETSTQTDWSGDWDRAIFYGFVVNHSDPYQIKELSTKDQLTEEVSGHYSDTSLDLEMARLDLEMQSIRLECESLANRLVPNTTTPDSNPPIESNQKHTYANIDVFKCQKQRCTEDKSLLDVNCKEKTNPSETNRIHSKKNHKKYSGNKRKTKFESELELKSSEESKTSNEREDVLWGTMYTNAKHLEHTIRLQQNLLREAIEKREREDKPNSWSQLTDINESRETAVTSLERSCPPVRLRPDVCWKVRRRSDGTRYITSRNARNKLLREREMQIMQERCTGLTTDDDALSELKVGRYWSKDQRKRHIEVAKDRKRRQMVVKMTALRELSEERTDSKEFVEKSSREKNGFKSVLSVTTV